MHAYPVPAVSIFVPAFSLRRGALFGPAGFVVCRRRNPYHSFYGFGDPKVTSAFTTDDPSRKSIVLLVIHGSGPEAWRAEKPKGKFVLINIPVQTVSVRRVKMGKKL